MAELVIEEIFISEASDLEYGEHRGHPMDISVDGFVDQDSDSDRMSIRSEDFDDPFEGAKYSEPSVRATNVIFPGGEL